MIIGDEKGLAFVIAMVTQADIQIASLNALLNPLPPPTPEEIQTQIDMLTSLRDSLSADIAAFVNKSVQ